MKQFRLFIALIYFIAPKLIFASQPDSIVIADNSWAFTNSYSYKYVLINNGKTFVLYQTYKFVRDNKGEKQSADKKKIGTVSFGKIDELITTLMDSSFSILKIENFGYNEEWINSNVDNIFGLIKHKRDHWTVAQIAFAKQQLSDFKNYQNAIRITVGQEGIYIIAKDGGTGFKANFYYPDKSIEVFANENPFGIPWMVNSIKSFNPAIPKLFSEIIPANRSFNKKRFDDFSNLIPELAKTIYDDECNEKMNELAALEFQNEINELKSKFQVTDAREKSSRDGYIWDNGQVINIKLHDTTMLPNLFIDLYLTRQHNTLFSRDPILKEGDKIVQTIQNVSFLKDFLLADSKRKLMIKFENGASINDKVIESFNNTPEHWKQSDKWTSMLLKDDSLGISHSFNTAESIKTSIQVDCGCNFRLDNNFLKSGIHFEIHDEKTNNWSTWIILPDSTIILWWIEGNGFSKYTYSDLGTNGRGVQYVCKKISRTGELKKE